jgi:hypothetical protein
VIANQQRASRLEGDRQTGGSSPEHKCPGAPSPPLSTFTGFSLPYEGMDIPPEKRKRLQEERPRPRES